MQKSLRYIVVATAIIIFPCALHVAGQTSSTAKAAQPEQAKILQALLDEIRLLRRDTRRAAVLQVTLAQVQSAQTNVESITRALQTASSRVNQIREEVVRTQSDLKDEEEQLGHNEDPEQRATYERNIEFMKKRLSDLPKEAQQMESREKELTDELQLAQSRFNILNKRLDDLLRQLDAP